MPAEARNWPRSRARHSDAPPSEIEGRISPSQAAPKPEVVFVAVLFAAASVFFGIFPSPLFQLAAHAGHALTGIF